MSLSGPTLFFTADSEIEASIQKACADTPAYVATSPAWETFVHLVSQIAFGLIVVDFAQLADADGSLDDHQLSRLVDDALEANSHARILIFNVPADEDFNRFIDAGVHDLVRAPFGLDELMLRIERAGEVYAWLAQRNYFVGQSGHIFRLGDLVGESTAMKAVFEQVGKVSASRSPVLVTGETGVGKELLAAAIHYNSPRRDQAFIKVNCAALQDTLLESELFGHEKGAFTGAVKQRIGRFEQAHHGTLFLDEIGDMSPATQAKVLRVLQSQEFERVGGTRLLKVDVRIIAATNRVLEQAIAAGEFREDLYYRLNVVSIDIPPLRARPDDIPLLARFFLKKARFEERKTVEDFSAEALAFLEAYHWPGNVRELENTVYRAVLLTEGKYIEKSDLTLIVPGTASTTGEVQTPLSAADPADGSGTESPGATPATDDDDRVGAGPQSLEEMERQAIIEALEASAWVQSRAARRLGISRRALNYRIAKYGLTHPSWRVNTPDS